MKDLSTTVTAQVNRNISSVIVWRLYWSLFSSGGFFDVLLCPRINFPFYISTI